MTDLRKILPFNNKSLVLAKHQSTGDIIGGMLETHGLYAKEYDKVSERFWRGDAESTAAEIYDYLKRNVKYSVEPYTDQTVKSPGAIVNERVGDCKHYAQFAVGVIDSLKRKGYPVSALFRFVSYDRDNRTPYHVFAVMRDNEGNEIWIDPCIKYDERLQYFYKVDKTPRMLSRVSGPDAVTAPAINLSNRDAVRSLVTWLQLNLFRLSEKLQRDGEAYRKTLHRFLAAGGSKPVFDAAIKQGVDFWQNAHQDKLQRGDMLQLNEYGYDVEFPMSAMIGIDPVTLTALISAGTSLATAGINAGSKSKGGGASSVDAQLYSALLGIIQSGKPLPVQAVTNTKALVTRNPSKFPMLKQLIQQYPVQFGGGLPSSSTSTPVPVMNPVSVSDGTYNQEVVKYGTYSNPAEAYAQTGQSTGQGDFLNGIKDFYNNNKTLVLGGTALLVLGPRILDALSGKRRR